MKHLFSFLCFSVILLSISVYAQKDTVYVPDTYANGGVEGTLNDSVAVYVNNGTVSNKVFKLQSYGQYAGLYILTGVIATQPGQVLEIVADPPTSTTPPPMIAWTTSTAPSKTYSFDIPGEIKMKNIWLLYGSVDGTRTGSAIRVGDSSSVGGGRCEFQNVIFDYAPISGSSSGCVEVYATHFKGSFENCYFKNCGDSHFRYYGRALSFPYSSTGLHSDSVSFENCTFANIGYVYMQEGAEYSDYVAFNHCTFYNVTMYTLESGWWNVMSVTNSLFVNTYMYGWIPAADGTGGGNGGTIAIASVDSTALGNGFGFTVPFTNQTRRILFANNSYVIRPWLVNWMQNNPYSASLHQQRLDDEIPRPCPMLNRTTQTFFDTTDSGTGQKIFPYINAVNLYPWSDPGFVNPPLALDSLKQYMYHKWSDNADVDWTWEAANDYSTQTWPMLEDLSYTNDTLLTAGMDGLPLGDLYRWFPAKYTQWKAQASNEHSVINDALMNGNLGPLTAVEKETGNTLPSKYSLSQNFPNPFNPTTKIKYSVPKDGIVSLRVYNLLGQEVAVLVNGYQRAGNYVATFDGSNLASGVYLYRLQSENGFITKKLVLLK